jgi:glycosyltransferase involved in cell wall biosynthesis
MDPETPSIAMLATGTPHHAHRGFAESVGADIVTLQPGPDAIAGTILGDALGALRAPVPDRDVLLLEGSGEVYATPRLARHTDATVIYVCDDHRPYGTASYDFSAGTLPTRLAKRVDRRLDAAALRALLARHVDGVIAGSGFMADVARAAAPDTPVRVAPPYIQSDVFDRLASVAPALDTNTAVTVGIGRDHKGVDRLVDVWPAVRDRVPDAELSIVGPGHPEAYADTPGVEVLGYVDPERLHEILAPASLYVHPARAEAFGVTVVEALRAGLPAVVTRTTGARSAARAVSPSLVVDSTPDAIADRVVAYFEADLDARRRLSKRARAEGATHDAEHGRRRFREQFAAVLAALPG